MQKIVNFAFLCVTFHYTNGEPQLLSFHQPLSTVGEANLVFLFSSLQCGHQVAQLKEENAEAKHTMQTLLSKLKQVGGYAPAPS